MEEAWAAGLFEGEGCISNVNVTGVNLLLGMTDEDVVRRFHAAVGVGVVGGPYRNREEPKYKSTFRWVTYNKKDTKKVLELFLPFFGERRKQRALEALERIAQGSQRKGWEKGRKRK
jgi:hypothetical protein